MLKAPDPAFGCWEEVAVPVWVRAGGVYCSRDIVVVAVVCSGGLVGRWCLWCLERLAKV